MLRGVAEGVLKSYTGYPMGGCCGCVSLLRGQMTVAVRGLPSVHATLYMGESPPFLGVPVVNASSEPSKCVACVARPHPLTRWGQHAW